jgi:hypothetical protein
VHAKGIDPEMVVQLRVTRRDVTCHSFAEAEFCEKPESGCQPLLAVQTFF